MAMCPSPDAAPTPRPNSTDICPSGCARHPPSRQVSGRQPRPRWPQCTQPSRRMRHSRSRVLNPGSTEGLQRVYTAPEIICQLPSAGLHIFPQTLKVKDYLSAIEAGGWGGWGGGHGNELHALPLATPAAEEGTSATQNTHLCFYVHGMRKGQVLLRPFSHGCSLLIHQNQSTLFREHC